MTKTVEAVETPKAPKVTIGSYTIELILTTQLSNAEILAKIKDKFADCQTSMACVAWYKSKLRKKGRIGKRTFKKVEVQNESKAN